MGHSLTCTVTKYFFSGLLSINARHGYSNISQVTDALKKISFSWKLKKNHGMPDRSKNNFSVDLLGTAILRRFL